MALIIQIMIDYILSILYVYTILDALGISLGRGHFVMGDKRLGLTKDVDKFWIVKNRRYTKIDYYTGRKIEEGGFNLLEIQVGELESKNKT